MIKRLYIVYLIIVPNFCFADLMHISEVTVTPQSVNTIANIGSVNSSVNVRMDLAKVDMFIGKPRILGKEHSDFYRERISYQYDFRNFLEKTKRFEKPDESRMVLLPLNIKAIFELVNESSDTLKLTVGFPVSNFQYSVFELFNFSVVTNDTVCEVFQRRSSYPKYLNHKYISGSKNPKRATPPVEINKYTVDVPGLQVIGKTPFKNMMVWEETFTPSQRKKIEISYQVDIPWQENKIVQSRVIVGKGEIVPAPIVPDAVPLQFLKKIDPGSYFFFDYYLTSGASWEGSIGFEEITLHFDRWWQGLEFYSTIKKDKLAWSNRIFKPNIPTTVTYRFQDKEPTENIYFAIRPGKNNKQNP